MMWWVIFQGRSPDFADIFFKLSRESNRYETQEVSNSERLTENLNNDNGENSQGFAGGARQDERTYIGVLHGA